MAIYHPKCLTIVAILAGSLGVASHTSAQPVIAYQWLPGSNSSVISAHSVVGPVVATDFIPATTGMVVQVDWWGSAPQSIANNDQFEITFHNASSTGVPAVTPPTGGFSQHFVNSPGTLTTNGVYRYSAAWPFADVSITAGTTYWFSVANSSGGTWTWANPLLSSPETGGQLFTDVFSVGGPGAPVSGPHGGPWLPVFPNQDFACQIWVTPIPEPSLSALGGVGLVLLGLRRLRILAV